LGNWVTAGSEDTFCSIAVDSGFVDCAPVRNHDANAAIRDRELRSGDEVYVPDLVERHDSAVTERTHIYVRRGVPFAAIRFVHGARATTIPDDITKTFLEISNYRTDRAGRDGLDAFAGPAHWQFDAASDADPDTFKVEVREIKTGKAQLDVTLEALHPIYVPGLGNLSIGVDLNWSSAAERDRRKLELKVHRATPKPDQRFRSAYLRLVADERDKAARPLQTLLVTDDQPNEEQVEILDQEVRATYKIESCARAGTNAQCRVTAQVPVGNNRRRIKLSVGIFRRNVGDATGFNGTTEAHIRHRLFRWFRRVYAQANMAPVLVPPGIRLLDPPERNMLTVSNINGNRAMGRRASGASPSRMSFTITTDRAGVAPKVINHDIAAAATPATRPKPIDIANALKLLIDDADFEANVFQNPAAQGRLRTNRSADIIVKDKTPGHRVTISAVSSTDNTATLTLALVNLSRVTDHGDRDMEFGTIEQRQIMRNFDSGDDRLDGYVVGRFQDFDLRGRSFTPCYELDDDYKPPPPGPFTTMMGTNSSSGHIMDASDNLPYTFPHEAGHALLDCFHVHEPGATTVHPEELMHSGTSVTAGVGGTKRICDAPVRVVYDNYHPTQTWVGRTGHFYYSMASRLRDAADGNLGDPGEDISSQIFEGW
jgi:hypothetical protein